jgi:hypothetical protein
MFNIFDGSAAGQSRLMVALLLVAFSAVLFAVVVGVLTCRLHVIDAWGRTCLSVPVTVHGRAVDSKRFIIEP